jgi:hypothetical protein
MVSADSKESDVKSSMDMSLSSTSSNVSLSAPSSFSLPSGVPVWKALSIFITLDILIWLAVRRFSIPKKTQTTSERLQQDFVSWSRMAYEQQQASFGPRPSNAQQRVNPMNSQTSTRVIDRHLDALGIPKVIGVLPKEADIKDAYRKICLKTHPDVLGTDHPEKQQAEKKFIEATTSYNYLLDYLKK